MAKKKSASPPRKTPEEREFEKHRGEIRKHAEHLLSLVDPDQKKPYKGARLAAHCLMTVSELLVAAASLIVYDLPGPVPRPRKAGRPKGETGPTDAGPPA